MGAFKFRKAGDKDFIGTFDGAMSVPPLTSLRDFTQIAQAYEAKPDNILWVTNLLRQGSSLGGARPKANMMDEHGILYIAKVPSIHDDYDVALWEHFAHQLAKKAGIQVAETKLMAISGFSHHVLLSKRFDRIGASRVHTVSAMTLTNLQDGADASSGNGYLDIVDTIVSGIGIADAEANLRELYRRVAFSICIGNHDDHFRNHAFVLTTNGWTLSPAYDINPTNMLTQSLLISESSCNSSLAELLQASAHYLLSKEVASQIINEVKDAVRDWRKVANLCHIPPSEQQRFANRLEYCL
jgi:serine/threonine-protein kinase HipA